MLTANWLNFRRKTDCFWFKSRKVYQRREPGGSDNWVVPTGLAKPAAPLIYHTPARGLKLTNNTVSDEMANKIQCRKIAST